MLLEERKLHMVAWSEEASAVLRSGEPVETKLHHIAEKDGCSGFLQIDHVGSRVRE